MAFEPELLQEPVKVIQLGDLSDVGLLSSVLKYVIFDYTPSVSTDAGSTSALEMRASMYANMLLPARFGTTLHAALGGSRGGSMPT